VKYYLLEFISGFWIDSFMKTGKYTLLAENPYGKGAK